MFVTTVMRNQMWSNRKRRISWTLRMIPLFFESNRLNDISLLYECPTWIYFYSACYHTSLAHVKMMCRAWPQDSGKVTSKATSMAHPFTQFFVSVTDITIIYYSTTIYYYLICSYRYCSVSYMSEQTNSTFKLNFYLKTRFCDGN